MTTQLLISKCGPHCGVIRSPTAAEKGNPPVIGHCEQCHHESTLPMEQRPRHGPRQEQP